jgi:hypothetical protein
MGFPFQFVGLAAERRVSVPARSHALIWLLRLCIVVWFLTEVTLRCRAGLLLWGVTLPDILEAHGKGGSGVSRKSLSVLPKAANPPELSS